MNQKDWIERLESEGWTRSVGGKHQTKMIKAGHRPITLPEHRRRDYPAGLSAAIRRQAGPK